MVLEKLLDKLSIKESRLLCICILILTPLMLCGQTQEEAQALHDKGRELMEAGKVAEGRDYTKRALDMRKQLFGEVNEDYISSLNNYANSFCMEENFPKAVEIQEEVMDLCGKLKKPHPNIGMYTTNMGRFYYLDGNMQGAVKCWEEAIPLVEKYGSMYEYLLNNLGNAYMELNDMANMERVLSLMKEHNEYQLKQPCDEPDCMLERAQYYAATEDNANAKESFLKLMGMQLDDEMKVKANDAYAQFLYDTKDYAASCEHLLLSANLQKEKNGLTEEYAKRMSTIGVYSFIGKLYQQSVDSYTAAIDYYSQHLSDEDLQKEVKCYMGMGNAYNGLKDYVSAKACFQKAVAYYETNDTANTEYPKAILRLAKMEKFNKDYDISIEHHKLAMRMFKDRNMIEEYSDAASSLKLCYVYAGKHEDVDMNEEEVKAVRYQKLDRIIHEEIGNLELYKKYLGELAYARSLATIAGCYYQKESYDSAIYYYKQYMDAVRTGIRNEFRLLSETERMTMWNEEYETMLVIKEMSALIPKGNEKLLPDLATLLYDAELLSKGILLKSSIEFGKLLEERGDSKLKALYDETKQNEKTIKHLREHASSEDDLRQIIAISQHNQALTLKLYKECKEFADFTDYLSYNWKDVQKELKETDIAVEFTAVRTGVLDSENYMLALVLTHNMSTPLIVPICNLDEARRMETCDNLFELKDNVVWGVLTPYLKGKRRIFFSADGRFNRIGIEYLLYNGIPLSEQFDVYRLSSTKELCYRHPQVESSKAALFGDINYNDYNTPDIPATPTKAYTSQNDKSRGAGGLNLFANLDNTLREIDGIIDILKESDFNDISKYTDVKASKSSFKSLDNTGINLLHIATHGAYDDNDVKQSNTASMNNSYLAFAGANISKDGIVTAAEIASLNLRQCDLVVLSACETGLGKLGSDGVYGLQRGFKNAGAHTLLMSLQNVYDAATADLMSGFYHYWLNGMSKREALVKAQQDLRKSGYKDAKYWATFILLDAY